MNGYLIAAIATTLFGGGFYLGGLREEAELAKYKTAVEAQYAANLKAVADTLNKQIQDGVAERAAQQKVIDAYDASKANPPATVGLADSLRDAAAASCPASRDVPKAGAVAGGTQAGAAQPGSGPSAARLSELTQAIFDASDADAKQMTAMIKLAP